MISSAPKPSELGLEAERNTHICTQSQPMPTLDEHVRTSIFPASSKEHEIQCTKATGRDGSSSSSSAGAANGKLNLNGTGSSTNETPAPSPETTALSPITEERVLVVGKGVHVTANVTSCDTVIIDGNFKGSIKTDTFVLAAGGQMEGEMQCTDGRIGGNMRASIVASNTLVIGKVAVVVGDVVYQTLEIVDGGRLEGSLTQRPSTQLAEPAIATVDGCATITKES